ncbi:MAG: hypothetical protein EP298_11045 [Gammaproteobacteria bacterium]|nr:MAG: hypothetical protein EP298_11045 [Gammaproteobacteria bacterium]UTW43517.1 hypothetical protein KFE69_05345 [bacterium SCSIO 12844]
MRTLNLSTTIFIILALFMNKAFSGQEWNVKIHNNTPWQLTIKKLDTDCWYAYDFERETILKSGDTKIFYTQQKNSGSCFFQKGALRFQLLTDYTSSTVKIRGRDSCQLEVTNQKNFDISMNCNGASWSNSKRAQLDITAKPPGAPLPVGLKSIGLGKAFPSACGKNLIVAPDGKLYADCKNSDDTNTIRVNFSNSTGSGCSILVDDSGVKSTKCDTNIDYTFYKGDIIFACQQASNSQSKCPWIFPQNKDRQYLANDIYS